MNPETRPQGEVSGGRLRARLSTELRDELVERTLARPLGAPTLVRLAQLCQLRGASVAQIARLAGADPGFAAALLRIASTSPPGRPGPVPDLPAAVARLGTRMVGMLAFAAPALRLLDAPDDELWEVRREIHRHAIRVGVVAREITPGSIQPEVALAAGLVHNVGLGMLSLDAPVGLRRALAAAAPGLPLWALEQEVFGFGHAELGGRLAREWRYPEYLVAAIEEHDAEQPSSPLAALIQVADLLVRERGVGIEPAMDVDPAVARMARLVPEQAFARTRWLLAVDRGGARDRELRPDELSAVQLIRAFDRLERAA